MKQSLRENEQMGGSDKLAGENLNLRRKFGIDLPSNC
jgi:hypothetical protein